MYIYIYMYVCMYVYIYIYIYIMNNIRVYFVFCIGWSGTFSLQRFGISKSKDPRIWLSRKREEKQWRWNEHNGKDDGRDGNTHIHSLNRGVHAQRVFFSVWDWVQACFRPLWWALWTSKKRKDETGKEKVKESRGKGKGRPVGTYVFGCSL